MDALSIAASLAALIGVVDNVAKGCRKLLALKHAPQILQQLNDELSDFQFVIATVEDVCREQEALETGRCFSQELLSAAIHRAKDAILDLEKMEAYGLLKTPDHRNPKIDFKFWIRNESKLREMRERLRHAKVDILVAFNADDM